jgi:hypothetical protein
MTMQVSLFDGALDRYPKALHIGWAGLEAMLSTPGRHSVPPKRLDAYAAKRSWCELYKAGPEGEELGAAVDRVVAETGAFPKAVEACLRKYGESGFTRGHMLKEEKRHCLCWSPVSYQHRAVRAKANVVELSALVLDYDDGCSIEEAIAPWMDWPWMVHTSWSHRVDHPKFRLVLPLERAVPAALWPRVYAWAIEHGGGRMDQVTKDASRLFFLPARQTEAHPFEFHVHVQGNLLCLDEADLPDLPEEKRVSRARTRIVRPPSHAAVDRARQARIKTDPETRRRIAVELGARITGGGTDIERAKGLQCPSCGRLDLYFFIDPKKMTRAHCAHRNSCGHSAQLWELL